MITVATVLLSLVGVVVTSLAINLLANQIDTWLPDMARRIVRHQARKMGSRAGRCEEEWLADLDDRRGGLAQLYFALGTLIVPLRIANEETPGGIVGWAWLIVPAGTIVLLLRAYPLEPSRYAAYAVLLQVVIVCAVCLAAPLRRVFAVRYERLNYRGRVGVGGLIVPAICIFTIALSLIPSSRRAATRKQFSGEIRDGKNLAVILLPTLPPANQAIKLVLITGPRQPKERLLDKKVPHTAVTSPILGVEAVNLPVVGTSLSQVPSVTGLEGTALVELPEQPLPSPESLPSPRQQFLTPPTGVRLIR
jgi:hypothetical protein